MIYELNPWNLKGESGLFLTPVLMQWGGSHIDCHVWRRVNYCTFGFDEIIQCDLRTLPLPCDSPRDNLYVCVI